MGTTKVVLMIKRGSKMTCDDKSQETEITPVSCFVCGKSCLSFYGDIPIGNEYATLHARLGYGSSKDSQRHTCRICETCYDKISLFITAILNGKIIIESYAYVPRVARPPQKTDMPMRPSPDIPLM